jgi:hypothetical protein
LAFNALKPWPEAGAFPCCGLPHDLRTVGRNSPLTPDMFVNGTMNVGFHGPSSAVISSAPRADCPSGGGLPATLATAPVWREFDVVARAPAVDIIGGSFRLPFSENRMREQMP